MTGSRKATAQLQAQVALLLAFLASAFLDVPESLFAAFVAGNFALLTSFIWGNVRVHQSQGGDNGQTHKRT